jgi:DNA-binding MarR family transcriptional regulator
VAEPPSPVRVGPGFEQEFPGVSALATETVVNIVHTQVLIQALANRYVQQYDLSTGAFNVLVILRGAGEPLPPSTISERLTVTRGTVTGVLDSLEKRGLVRRTPHPTDRRSLLVEITEKGLGLLDELVPQVERDDVEWVSVLNEEEKETLIQLLGKIQGHLRQLLGQPVRPQAAARLDTTTSTS